MRDPEMIITEASWGIQYLIPLVLEDQFLADSDRSDYQSEMYLIGKWKRYELADDTLTYDLDE